MSLQDFRSEIHSALDPATDPHPALEARVRHLLANPPAERPVSRYAVYAFGLLVSLALGFALVPLVAKLTSPSPSASSPPRAMPYTAVGSLNRGASITIRVSAPNGTIYIRNGTPTGFETRVLDPAGAPWPATGDRSVRLDEVSGKPGIWTFTITNRSAPNASSYDVLFEASQTNPCTTLPPLTHMVTWTARVTVRQAGQAMSVPTYVATRRFCNAVIDVPEVGTIFYAGPAGGPTLTVGQLVAEWNALYLASGQPPPIADITSATVYVNGARWTGSPGDGPITAGSTIEVEVP